MEKVIDLKNINNIMRIITNIGWMECARGHQFKIKDKWVDADQITIGDIIEN